MPDLTLFDQFWPNIVQVVSLLGGFAVVSGGTGAAVSSYFSARGLAKQKALFDQILVSQKADLDRTLATHKADLDKVADKFRADLSMELERIKLRLERREFLFEAEISAASALSEVRRQVEPRYSHPDMDWHDAITEVHNNLGQTEKLLSNFIIHHGSVLPLNIWQQIDELRKEADDLKFDFFERGVIDDQLADVADAFL